MKNSVQNNYSYDLLGFLKWWEEVIHGRRLTDDEVERVSHSFYLTELKFKNLKLK